MEALIAGNIETKIVIKIEEIEIIKIEDKLISDGILLKKYISSGKRLMLNTWLKKDLKFSIYMEKTTPITTPKRVAEVPIITPTKKKIFVIDLFKTPIDFNIAMSFIFN